MRTKGAIHNPSQINRNFESLNLHVSRAQSTKCIDGDNLAAPFQRCRYTEYRSVLSVRIWVPNKHRLNSQTSPKQVWTFIILNASPKALASTWKVTTGNYRWLDKLISQPFFLPAILQRQTEKIYRHSQFARTRRLLPTKMFEFPILLSNHANIDRTLFSNFSNWKLWSETKLVLETSSYK